MTPTPEMTAAGVDALIGFNYGDPADLTVNAVFDAMYAAMPAPPPAGDKPAPIFTARLMSSTIVPPWHNTSVRDSGCTIGAVTPASAGIPKIAGDYVLKARMSGSSSGYARVHFQHDDVPTPRWKAGSEVWYSAKFFLPVGYHANKTTTNDIMRWDCYVDGSSDMQGGLGIGSDGNFYIMSNYPYTRPIDTQVRAPEGRWFEAEVHQIISTVDGQAFNELFIDGARIGQSTKANYKPYTAGQNEINRLRFGLVSEGTAADTNVLYLDDAVVRVKL